ncbi:MAG: FKBP-type peptidyl-prolyl cis-trans isomerase [Bacteroidales bacterium]|nr:FKBP-type peptidyl-prolyl cis-trans isomerase [Bacteroidales bacterium]
MKKVVWVAAAITIFGLQSTLCQAQEIKVKKGKVTMTEAQYNDLKAKADAYEKAQAEAKTNEWKASAYDHMNAQPATFNDSASYAIGRDVYRQWQTQKLGINGKMVGLAMRDCAEGHPLFGDETAMPLLQRFQREFEERQASARKQNEQLAQENIERGEKFMKEIGNNKSVYSTKSGLKYRMVNKGNGKKPAATDLVKVHYVGKLIDGTVFDSSKDRGTPAEFRLNEVIAGWTEGLQLMDEGSKYILYIPYNLGYGMNDMGSIPPGSTLIFEVELLEINPQGKK